jgi:hypothetical protein
MAIRGWAIACRSGSRPIVASPTVFRNQKAGAYHDVGERIMPALERYCTLRNSRRLSGGSRDEGRDDVRRVSIKGAAGAVVAHGCARVGVALGFLDVTQCDASVPNKVT